MPYYPTRVPSIGIRPATLSRKGERVAGGDRVRIILQVAAALALANCGSPSTEEKRALEVRIIAATEQCKLDEKVQLTASGENSVTLSLAEGVRTSSANRHQIQCVMDWVKANPDIVFGFTGNELAQ